VENILSEVSARVVYGSRGKPAKPERVVLMTSRPMMPPEIRGDSPRSARTDADADGAFAPSAVRLPSAID
jgi:hypothetical protein